MSAFSQEEIYDREIKLSEDKVLHLRKWKVKDRNAFKQIIKEKGESLTPIDISSALVFPCIKEKNILLTEEEIKNVLYSLREISIKADFDFTFLCDEENCEKLNTTTIKVQDINKIVKSNWSEVEIFDDVITFGERVQPEFYYNTIYNTDSENQKEQSDLAMHIVKIGNDDSMSFSETITFLNNLDTDVLDKIQEEYNKQKFKQDTLYTVKCECGKEQNFIFDEIPNFFPTSWFE
jgi:hypothetical protein